ncbi:MAG TPA: methylmalonyl-CoA epimerase, partial [Thermoanaerobaculia bacterium]|nr:methylmalonyl-CoA epimerase [Thermoanaerobaculia bacterium]
CLRSGDVLAADQALRAGGFELVRGAPGPGAEGSLVQFLHPRSSGGVLLEVSQPASGHGKQAEVGRGSR